MEGVKFATGINYHQKQVVTPVGYLSVKTDRFSVNEIIGRTVVIHSDPDDFHTQPAGNAGKKIACGVIQRR